MVPYSFSLERGRNRGRYCASFVSIRPVERAYGPGAVPSDIRRVDEGVAREDVFVDDIGVETVPTPADDGATRCQAPEQHDVRPKNRLESLQHQQLLGDKFNI